MYVSNISRCSLPSLFSSFLSFFFFFDSFYFFFLSKRNHWHWAMVFFAALKNLFSRRDKRTSNASSLRSKKKGLSYSNGSQQNNSNRSAAANSPSNSTTNNSSNNGHSFQFKDGRRYHGDSEVAYVLPNDDDGNTAYNPWVTWLHLNTSFLFRGWSSASTALDSSLCITVVGIESDHWIRILVLTSMTTTI